MPFGSVSLILQKRVSSLRNCADRGSKKVGRQSFLFKKTMVKEREREEAQQKQRITIKCSFEIGGEILPIVMSCRWNVWKAHIFECVYAKWD